MKSSVPSLTADGFITNKRAMLSKLWLYFLAADYSQSNAHYGKIASLKYILEKKTPSTVKREIEDTVKNLYSNYFDNVEVYAELEESSTTAEVTIKVDVRVTDDNKTYVLNEVIVDNDSKIKNFDDLLDEYYASHSDSEV